MADSEEETHLLQPRKRRGTVVELANADGFGGKTIGFFGGVCLLLNNIVGKCVFIQYVYPNMRLGPGIVALPLVINVGGWLFPSMLLSILGILSTYILSLYVFV